MRIRPLRHWERHRVAAYYLALPLPDRRRRFCGGVGEDFVKDYVRRLDWGRASVFAAFEGDAIVGVVELVRPPGHWIVEAEIAISVAPGFRRQGVGAALMRAALAHARNRFLAAAYVVTAADNRPMQALAARFGAAFKSSFGEIEGRISLAWPGYDSLVNEAAAESVAMLATAFDAPPHSGRLVQPERP